MAPRRDKSDSGVAFLHGILSGLAYSSSRSHSDSFNASEVGDFVRFLAETGNELASLMRLDTNERPGTPEGWEKKVEQRRANVYKAAAAAKRPGEGSRLFTTKGKGIVFRLEGDRDSPIPFQHIRIGPGAIPSELADTRCNEHSVEELFDVLSAVFGSQQRSLDEPGMGELLQDFIDEDFDFGQVYGYLRPWWRHRVFAEVPKLMERRKSDDIELRVKAMDGDRITDPKVPPRRVWDLYSNRVLPYYALALDNPSKIPRHVWTVSHGWVGEQDRRSVWTRINSYQWPVPIPKGIRLEDLRIELLNLGAEYVFLDVLCLRQEGERQKEHQRKKEWKLDVPTIGHVYQHDPYQTTITYFNGLGKPVKLAKHVVRSERHWFNRVWTLQETTTNWVPGGITNMDPDDDLSLQDLAGPMFSDNLQRLLDITVQDHPDIFFLIDIIRRRSSSKPVDRVSGLGYLLQCGTLPIYEENMDVEDAWEALVQCMQPALRTDILMGWFGSGAGQYTWRPSWEQLMGSSLVSYPIMGYSSREKLRYMTLGCLDGSDAYHHRAYLIRKCSIRPSQRKRNKASEFDAEAIVEIPLRSGKLVVEASDCGDELLQGHGREFAMVGIADLRLWVVGNIVGMRNVGGLKGYEFEKLSVLQIDDERERKKFYRVDPGQPETLIVYCPSPSRLNDTSR